MLKNANWLMLLCQTFASICLAFRLNQQRTLLMPKDCYLNSSRSNNFFNKHEKFVIYLFVKYIFTYIFYCQSCYLKSILCKFCDIYKRDSTKWILFSSFATKIFTKWFYCQLKKKTKPKNVCFANPTYKFSEFYNVFVLIRN